MRFDEYWDRLFNSSATAFVKDRQGKTFPLRLGDRQIAEHFWDKARQEQANETQMRDGFESD